MAATIDRDELIELLDRLGAEDDADALAAARAVAAKVEESDQDWDSLLTKPAKPSSGDRPAPTAAPPGDDKALIETMLAKFELSEDTREELQDYLTDIAEGEFTAEDSAYLQALYKRLAG